MVSTYSEGSAPADIRQGNQCMLWVAGEQYLVEIGEVRDDTMTVSFPYGNYPLDGTQVELEFHDTNGFTRYSTLVARGPIKADAGVILERPQTARRNQHRSSYRVSTDLTGHVKDQVHLREYDAGVINISEGGALIRAEAPFEFGTTVEMTLSLPGEPVYTFIGTVAHVTESNEPNADGDRLFGIRFLDIDPSAEQALARFVRGRIEEMHSRGQTSIL